MSNHEEIKKQLDSIEKAKVDDVEFAHALIANGRWLCNQLREALEREANLKEELEAERLRLAGCGVAALQNTEESKAKRITRDNPYWSASYGDVCGAVDREMKLRAELEIAVETLASISQGKKQADVGLPDIVIAMRMRDEAQAALSKLRGEVK